MAYLKWGPSLRGNVLLPVTTITLILGLILIGIGYWAAHRVVEIMAVRLTQQITQSVTIHVGLMMENPARLLRRAVDTFRSKSFYRADPRTLARELYLILGDDPAVDWVYFANPKGGIVSVGRLFNGKARCLDDRWGATGNPTGI